MLFNRFIRIYHKNHKSYSYIIQTDFYQLLEKLDNKKIEKAYYIGLAVLFSKLNFKDKLTEVDFGEYCIKELQIIFMHEDLFEEFEEYFGYTTELLKELWLEYSKETYIDKFRGDWVEFLTVKIFSNKKTYKIYHEPYIRRKRKPLIPLKEAGSNSLIDVVGIKHNCSLIHLIECKANINNFLRNPKKRNRKIYYMNRVKREFEKYKYIDNKKVKVQKGFMSLITPAHEYSHFQDYKVYYLIDELEKMAE